ncbi:MAG: glycosyltransferase family 2 protein [Mailhella sp.]|jgi:glycosyltransferase involved in cell wall biosynthesis|nr:glycosyltransferase family 2 protein [Mailhella sp.]MBR6624628.1 glycosyltransferase family 2 protein [Mailhella sp.]
MEKPVRLTGLIITLNGERTLDRCLELLEFCDRVLIVDSFSTDATEEIAKKRGAIFIQHKFEGYFEQIQYGIDWLAENAPTEWIFFLDCDEVCTFELRRAVLEAIDNKEGNTAYSVRRTTWYMDRFLKHGDAYPDRLFRLFRPEAIRLAELNGHPTYTPAGKHGQLEADLLHYSWPNFYNQLEKLNIYAERGAESMRRRGKKGGLAKALLHALWRFISVYFKRLGFLDGKAGFIYALHGSFYTFVKYIRLDEGSWGAPYDHVFHEANKNPESKRG